MATIAIEFEENQLLVAVCQKTAIAQEISHALSIGTKDLSDDSIGELLSQELVECQAAKSDTIAIVSRSLAEVRELTVPPAPDEELPEMIRFQARTEFASFNDQWKLDYAPLTSAPDAPRRVLAAAISPQLESQIQTICQSAGLKLKQVVLRPFATLDLLRSTLDPQQPTLIVDQNVDSTDMSIIQNAQLVSTRTVRLPQSLTPEQHSKQLITEVRRTLASHKISVNSEAVTQVVVSGNQSRHRHLKGDLEGKLGLSVSFINPFDLAGGPQPSSGDTEIEPARFTSLLGALKSYRNGSSPQLDFINVRKTEVKKTDYSKIYLYAAISATAVLMGLLLAWWVLRTQAQKIEAARANLVDAIKINAGDDRFPSVEQKLSEVRLIDRWKTEDVNWLSELSKFSQRYLLPDDVIVDAFTASVQRDGVPKIVLKGRIVEELSKTDQLIKALTERPYEVEPIDTGTVARDQQTEYRSTFEYHLRIPESAKTNIDALNQRAIAVTQENPASPSPVGLVNEATPSNAGGDQ